MYLSVMREVLKEFGEDPSRYAMCRPGTYINMAWAYPKNGVGLLLKSISRCDSYPTGINLSVRLLCGGVRVRNEHILYYDEDHTELLGIAVHCVFCEKLSFSDIFKPNESWWSSYVCFADGAYPICDRCLEERFPFFDTRIIKVVLPRHMLRLGIPARSLARAGFLRRLENVVCVANRNKQNQFALLESVLFD